LDAFFERQNLKSQSILGAAMRKIGPGQGWSYLLAVLLWAAVFQSCVRAQPVLKFSPKVMEVLNSPPLELKDDDTELIRLKKQRFNAALNEAKARYDLYKRGLTKLPDLIEVGARIFTAEVDLYDKPEDRARVLQRHLDIYNEAEGNLERHVKEGLATQADLEQLRYDKATLEIDLLNTKNGISPQQPTPQPSPP
jgi:hypothetical protein